MEMKGGEAITGLLCTVFTCGRELCVTFTRQRASRECFVNGLYLALGGVEIKRAVA